MLQTTNLVINRHRAPTLSFPSLNLEPGARTLLLGASGSGKTTWLSAIGGLLPPDDGCVQYNGVDIYRLSGQRRDRWRGQNCGFVFQALHLIPSLTVRQNITLAAQLAAQSAKTSHVDTLLAKLNLTDKAHRKPAALSHGEQQRAAIARAVINRPSIILADEPTSALDDDNAMAVINILESCAADTNAALLIATHDQRLRARFPHYIEMGAS